VRLGLIGAAGVLSVVAVWSLVANQALFAGRDALARKEWVDARRDARRAHALLHGRTSRMSSSETPRRVG